MTLTRQAVLIIDEAPLSSCVSLAASEHNLDLTYVDSLLKARQLTSHSFFSAVVLDIALVGDAWPAVLSEFVETSGGVIICTARASLTNKLVAFELGADDFVPKPFHVEELIARIKAMCRRSMTAIATHSGTRVQASTSATVTFDDWSFNFAKRELRSPAGMLVNLTTNEYHLLKIFTSYSLISLSRLKIIEALGKSGEAASVRTIDVMIAKLRRKLRCGDSELIKTIRGGGYMFAAEVALRESQPNNANGQQRARKSDYQKT